MMEVRDYLSKPAFRVDAEQGLLIRKNEKESIEILLPAGGSVVLTRDGVFTVIRRLETGQFDCYSEKMASWPPR